MTRPSIQSLAVALAATERVIADIRHDQWTDSTPCTLWNVREVLDHLVAGNLRFGYVLRGETAPAPESTLSSSRDPLSAYRGSAAALLDAFEQPGVLDRVFSVPFGAVPGAVALHLRITEALVHGWDLARSTGQPATFPADLAQQELAFTRANLTNMPADRAPFAPPQPVAADAPAIDQLAARLGRSVATRATVAERRL